jgi:hypothetical protein
MLAKRIITASLGCLVIALGVTLRVNGFEAFFVPLTIGCCLVYLGWRPSRVATIVFGHVTIVVGCFMVTWGIYLLPYSKPTVAHIFGRPLFWGMFAIFGGICAIYHGFCRCVMKSDAQDNLRKAHNQSLRGTH